MEIPALTSLSPEILKELKRGLPRTLEVQSAHNVITIANVNPGDHIFMTSVDPEDLSPGDRGIVANVPPASSPRMPMPFSPKWSRLPMKFPSPCVSE